MSHHCDVTKYIGVQGRLAGLGHSVVLGMTQSFSVDSLFLSLVEVKTSTISDVESVLKETQNLYTF